MAKFDFSRAFNRLSNAIGPGGNTEVPITTRTMILNWTWQYVQLKGAQLRKQWLVSQIYRQEVRT